MDLLNKKFLKRGQLNLRRENGNLHLENRGDTTAFLVLPRINFFKKKASEFSLSFFGEVEYGKAPQIKILNRKFKTILTGNFNEDLFIHQLAKVFIFGIKVPPKSKVVISKLSFDYDSGASNKLVDFAQGNTLVLAPGYPSEENKYFFGFVHTRVKEYKKQAWNIDVVRVDESKTTRIYNHDGVDICKTTYLVLRNLLQVKRYDRIIIHYFKPEFAQILDASDTSNTKVMIVSHGGDTMYRDFKKTTNTYFTAEREYYPTELEQFKKYDRYIKEYAQMNNVAFQFGTTWAKERAEMLTGCKFERVAIISNYIDSSIYQPVEKTPELRKKILILRKFDNVSTYANDINVKVILELSKRSFFNDLEFSIYGDGNYHDVLLAPIEDFDNVHIHQHFLNPVDIAKVYKEHGIALFATRYETQGVAATEAAQSGLVVLTSDVAAVPEVFGRKLENLFPCEDYIAYADAIEKLYYDEKYFVEQSKKFPIQIEKTCGHKVSIEKEMEYFDAFENSVTNTIDYPERVDQPVLTIAIPSYNVERFIRNTVFSLINTEVASKLEVLIISDGSKDQTVALGQELQDMTTKNGKSIVTIIDKENGGHGSTINKGIELATGKYFKLLDGDDYFDKESIENLVHVLENETSDIILNNYVEDFAETCTTNAVRHYEFMTPGKQYQINDLCYEGYGFKEWGPLLSTSTYRTEILKTMNYKISENSFYVDMEFNFIGFVKSETVTYYPYDIYYYYLGRPGQSVSPESFKRNFRNHEHVTLRILRDFYTMEMSKQKRRHLYNKIVVPMVVAQYFIMLEYINNRTVFNQFDIAIKEYPELYNHPKVAIKRVRLQRKTKGLLMKPIRLYSSIKSKLIKR